MEGKLLKVLERHQVLMLAVHKQIKLKEAAKQLGLSLRHTKRLARGLRDARGDFTCLLFQRQHPSWNRLPQQVRNAVIALKEERPKRSNPFIAELLDELYGIKVHPTTVWRDIPNGFYLRCLARGLSSSYPGAHLG